MEKSKMQKKIDAAFGRLRKGERYIEIMNDSVMITTGRDDSVLFIFLESGYAPKNAYDEPMTHGYPILSFTNYYWIEAKNPLDKKQHGWWDVNAHPLEDFGYFFKRDIDLRVKRVKKKCRDI